MTRSERVLISLYARDLKNVAGTFKGTSDPFAVVTRLADQNDVAAHQSSNGTVLGKTEVIKNNLNPVWTKTISLSYNLGRPVYLNVGVWDEVRKSKEDKPMGSAMFELGDVLGTRGNTKAKRLKNGGTLFMRVVRDSQMNSLHVTGIAGKKLANVEGGLFGKSDPFFEIAAPHQGPGGVVWNTVYRSVHRKDTLNPTWDAFQIDMDQLRSETDNTETASQSPLRFSIFDHESSGKHEFMGTFETNVGALLTPGVTFTVKSKKGKPAGTIEFKQAVIRHDTSPNGNGQVAFTGLSASSTSQPPTPFSRRPSFVDYISGSCEINMSVAIDFTGSNGDPRQPGTLHYIHRDGQLNDYEKAITAIGEIISRYDSDQRYPVYGFGAKMNGYLSHCFECGGRGEVSGVSGILQAYRGTFTQNITLSGPTLFQDVIHRASMNAAMAQDNARRAGRQAYSVLLIITDGAVSDVNATKNALIAASQSPLSVVIVGVGNADFSAMQFLDDFRAPPPSSDIAQFVEFRRHAHDKRSLTEATLEEIPEQLVSYFTKRQIFPTPMMSTSKLSIHPEPYNQDTDIDLNLDFKDGGDVEIDMSGPPGTYDYSSYGADTKYLNVVPMPVHIPQTTQPTA